MYGPTFVMLGGLSIDFLNESNTHILAGEAQLHCGRSMNVLILCIRTECFVVGTCSTKISSL